MKKQLVLLAIIVLTSSMMVYCKKYPKGGFLNRSHKNLRNNFNKLYFKAWKVSSYKVNGIDSTSSFKKEGNAGFNSGNFNNYDIEIHGELGNKEKFNLKTEHYSFNVEMMNDKKNITFEPVNPKDTAKVICSGNTAIKECETNIFFPESYNKEKLIWKIMKLTKDEFILTSRGYFSYEIRLEHVETFAD